MTTVARHEFGSATSLPMNFGGIDHSNSRPVSPVPTFDSTSQSTIKRLARGAVKKTRNLREKAKDVLVGRFQPKRMGSRASLGLNEAKKQEPQAGISDSGPKSFPEQSENDLAIQKLQDLSLRDERGETSAVIPDRSSDVSSRSTPFRSKNLNTTVAVSAFDEKQLLPESIVAVDHTPAVKIDIAGKDGIPDSYIVTLKKTSDQKLHMDWIKTVPNTYTGQCEIEFEYAVFGKYSAKLTDRALEAVSQRDDVKSIRQNRRRKSKRGGVEKNKVLTESPQVAQSGAPWGLQRISSQQPIPHGCNPTELIYTYYRIPCPNPNPVDVYIIDTGVYIEHDDFDGRASWGHTVLGASETDLDGHGTHVAAIIAGRRFGVAKNANIIALKDADDNDNEQTNWTVDCFRYVVENAVISNRRSIVNYSSNWDYPEEEINEILEATILAGVAICASAGNDDMDASANTPQCVPGVVTVGAIDAQDRRCSDSNYGPAIKIFAPGEDIISAGIADPTSQEIRSGTSFASPHVAGVMAEILSRERRILNPVELFELVKEMAIQDKIDDVGCGSPNLLLHNGVGKEELFRDITTIRIKKGVEGDVEMKGQENGTRTGVSVVRVGCYTRGMSGIRCGGDGSCSY
ncbi:subtilisin-like protease 8 [Ceratobasidium sp. AG-Ba]|nr:subtilisin-like protease 8 [Ceratobasidium sp. AG-Ba]